MKNYSSLLLFLITSVFLPGCKDDSDHLENKDSTVQAWIYNVMKNSYLWLDEIKDYEYYKTNADPEAFFYSLISDQEVKKNNESSYCYSYIEKKPAVTKSTLYPENMYGIEYQLYIFDEISPNLYARILYVVPGSPAEKAGLKRGMWILNMDGNSINKDNADKLRNGKGIALSIFSGDLVGAVAPQRVIKVAPSVVMFNNPILKDTTFTFSGKKVGYLAYNQFLMGPTSVKDESYNNALRKIFAEFKAQSVDEFILDLRYNPGGYLSCAQLLASFLVKEEYLGDVFCKLSFNPERKDIGTGFDDNIFKFDVSLKGKQNLNLSRVYILTGERSASASEAVLNGLLALDNMKTIQIGACTEGKNLGSETYESDKYDWILHPIVAKIVNKKGWGDYWYGFEPQGNYFYNEYRSTAMWGELGTLEDELIYRAVNDMGILPLQVRSISPSRESNAKIDLIQHSTSISRYEMNTIRIN